ncbi:MAG: hypothetical protein NTV88_05050, partial [Candidatus Micrarchaeota archaeon]|nr:hypothetical protein [Candidatus Micrarchaeota archaeon]
TMNGIGLTALSLAGTGWGSYTNLFINNTLISAGGTLLSISAMSGNNTFYWNNFTNTSGAYVQDFNFTSSGASSNLFNTSNSTTPMGNIYFNVMNGSVAIRGTYPAPFPSGQPTAFYYGSAGAGYPYNNSSTGIGGKFIGNGTDYGPITSSSGLSCGIINTAGTYTMNSNLSSPGATCFNITAANVLLNCSNYTIKGDNTTGTYGIVTSAYNTTIINCSINSFYYGIYYANGSYNGTAQYNTVYSNLDIGLRFVNSSNNSLTSNSFCTEPMDIDNAGLDNGGSFGTLNTCDSFLNYSENSHSGCTFACTSLWHRFFGNVSGNIVLGNGAAYGTWQRRLQGQHIQPLLEQRNHPILH